MFTTPPSAILWWWCRFELLGNLIRIIGITIVFISLYKSVYSFTLSNKPFHSHTHMHIPLMVFHMRVLSKLPWLLTLLNYFSFYCSKEYYPKTYKALNLPLHEFFGLMLQVGNLEHLLQQFILNIWIYGI